MTSSQTTRLSTKRIPHSGGEYQIGLAAFLACTSFGFLMISQRQGLHLLHNVPIGRGSETVEGYTMPLTAMNLFLVVLNITV